mmetsp:Transcript_5686/g.20389  ORF Transcript_5686/g.20389 Transcript_5686/m.20389 type:complete len:312 (+) Transcript_5686:2589-3524(+)
MKRQGVRGRDRAVGRLIRVQEGGDARPRERVVRVGLERVQVPAALARDHHGDARHVNAALDDGPHLLEEQRADVVELLRVHVLERHVLQRHGALLHVEVDVGAVRVLALHEGALQRRHRRLRQVQPHDSQRRELGRVVVRRPAPPDGHLPALLVLRWERHVHDVERVARQRRHRRRPRAREGRQRTLAPDVCLDGLQRREQALQRHLPRHDDAQVVGAVVVAVVPPHLVHLEVAQVGHEAARLAREAVSREQRAAERQVRQRVRRVLARLHLAVHDARVLAVRLHVVHLGDEARVGDRRVQHVVAVDGEQV